MTVTLKRTFDVFYNSLADFYRNPDNTVSVCTKFIKRNFSIESTSIIIRARITNPKKKGWKKININNISVNVSGKRTGDVIHYRLWNYLDDNHFPSKFYIKVSENNV